MTAKLFLFFVGAVVMQNHVFCMEEDPLVEQARRELKENPFALHYAAQQGNLEKALLLLTAGANVDAQDDGDRTPLHEATRRGYKEVAELLIKHRANVDAQDDDDRTPLHWAAEKGRKEVAELLINHKANVDAQDDEGRTPLHLATEKGRKEVAELLIKHKANVDARDNEGRTPLHLAAGEGRKEVAELLIKHKASVDARDNGGRTPLHEAVWDKRQELAKLLLLYNASVIALDNAGSTSLHYVTELPMLKILLFYRRDPAEILPLKELCLRYVGSKELSQKCLDRLPEELKEAITSEQELQKADRESIRHALAIRNTAGRTARDVAAEAGYKDIVAFIDAVLKAVTLDDLKKLGYRG